MDCARGWALHGTSLWSRADPARRALPAGPSREIIVVAFVNRESRAIDPFPPPLASPALFLLDSARRG
eukprot:scaffold89320_cov66-Phaeocystis_antarctica.AAC.4